MRFTVGMTIAFWADVLYLESRLPIPGARALGLPAGLLSRAARSLR